MEEQQVINDLEQSQQTLLKWMGELRITTNEEQRNAEDILISARRALKEAQERRMELTRPLDDSKKRIIELFKPYIDRLEQGINTVNKALVSYHEKKRIEVEAARMAALAEEAARFREAQETGEVIELPAIPPAEPVPTTSRAHFGSVSYREDYDIQIVNPNMVPRDLCEPSMVKIRARVKSGITQIPGVSITRKHITTTRTTGERAR